MDPETFKEHDAGSYDGAAEDYGTYIERLAAPLADHLCDLARLGPGDTVLDVGCGTGLAARHASARVGAGGRVVGIDFSRGMIATACRLTPDVDFRVMDAESLQFEGASFDAVISLCAVMHFFSISTAVDEMYRVVKPGGRLAVAFGYSRPPTLSGIASRAFSRLLTHGPRLTAPGALRQVAQAHLPWSDDQTDILSEWSQHQPVRRLRAELVRAGFGDVTVDWLRHEVAFESPADFAAAQMAIDTEVRKRLAAAPRGTLDALRDELIRRSESVVARGGMLVYPYQAVFFAARRFSTSARAGQP